MSTKLWLGAMVAGTAIVMLAGARRVEPAREPPPPRAEVPWISSEELAEVVGPEGGLGPLFAGVELGYSAPPAELRTRIDAFARAHGLDIAFEIRNGDVAAVRLVITYGGCCGYEAADVFARSLGRPSTGSCCVCIGPDTWINDWARVPTPGVHMRANVNANRVSIRWERAPSFAEILERADALMGADREVVAKVAGDRWHEIEPGRRYWLEMPFPYVPPGDFGSPPTLTSREDLGIAIETKAGKITAVSMRLRSSYDSAVDWKKLYRAQWGKPRGDKDTWVWRKPDRTIEASASEDWPTITISSP